MKRTLLLLIIIIIAACSSDDNNDETQVNAPMNVFGEWTLENRKIEINSDFIGIDVCGADKITFNNSNTSNNLLIQEQKMVDAPGTGCTFDDLNGFYTFNTEQTEFRTSIDGIVENNEIIELTSTTLVIRQKRIDNEAIDGIIYFYTK